MFLIVVTFFSLAALYVIISVGLGWLPLIGHCVNAERINIVLLNLSYSYVASVLFFLYDRVDTTMAQQEESI